MEPKICAKQLVFVMLIIINLGVAKCEEDDSEEYKRPIQAIYITPDDPVLTYSVGDSRMMTCVGSDINWRSPNGTLVDSKRGRVHVEDGSVMGARNQTLRLIIERIEEVDNGEWSCVGNFDEKSFIMFVYVPVDFVPVSELTITASEHENVTLACAATGNPQPHIHWDFKGSKISNVEEKLASHFIHMTDGLFIKNASREHSGEYTCKAVQVASESGNSGMKEMPIQLNVQFAPEIENTQRTTSSQGNFADIKFGVINGSTSLVCKALGFPLPTFLWYHNGKQMSHHHISSTDNLSTLTVHFKTNKTFGDYKCKARNVVGKAEAIFKIIEGKLPDPPEVFKLVGTGCTVLDINVGAKKADANDPLAITHFRFEIMFKKDFERNEGEWKSPFISDKKAESNVNYTLTGLKPNTIYLVKVAAINAAGLGKFTVIKEWKTLAEEPKKDAKGAAAATYTVSVYPIVIGVAVAQLINWQAN